MKQLLLITCFIITSLNTFAYTTTPFAQPAEEWSDDNFIEAAGLSKAPPKSSIDIALEDVRRREAERHPEQSQTPAPQPVSSSDFSWRKYNERKMKEAAQEEIKKVLHRNYLAEKKKEEARKRKENWPIALRNMGIVLLSFVVIYIIGTWNETKQAICRTRKRAKEVLKRSIAQLNLTTTVSCLLLLLALAHMPYWYYTMLRVCVCAYSVSNVLQERSNTRRMLYIGLGILYNPVAPLHLEREVWEPINIATIILLILLRVLRPTPSGATGTPETPSGTSKN